MALRLIDMMIFKLLARIHRTIRLLDRFVAMPWLTQVGACWSRRSAGFSWSLVERAVDPLVSCGLGTDRDGAQPRPWYRHPRRTGSAWATAATLRRTLFCVPRRLVRSARRSHLRLPPAGPGGGLPHRADPHHRYPRRGGVGHEPPRRQVCQPGGLQLGDGLPNDGVPAVVGLDLDEFAGPVGDKGVVVPRGEQRQLRPRGRANAANNKAHIDRVAAAGEAAILVSATSAPDTSGVDSQYGIGCQAASGMASIAARILRFCRAVTENRTSSLRAVDSTARE